MNFKDNLFYFFFGFIFLLVLFFISIKIYNHGFKRYGYTVVDFDNNVYFTERDYRNNKDLICIKDKLCVLPKSVEKTHIKVCTHLGKECTDWEEIK